MPTVGRCLASGKTYPGCKCAALDTPGEIVKGPCRSGTLLSVHELLDDLQGHQ